MTRLNIMYRVFEGFETALTRQGDAFRIDHPDVELGLDSADTQTLYTEMFTNGRLKSGEVDIFMCCSDWLAEAMQDAHVLCLDEHLAADPPPDWPEGWAPTVLGLQQDIDGRVWGIPYHNGPEVFMYRTDLFEDPREQLHFERQFGRPLAPPATWSEFFDLARFFNRPDDDLSGCVVAGKPDGHNSVYDFCIHLWSRGGELLSDAGRPIFDSGAGRDALRFYLDLIHTHGVTQPEPWEYDSVGAGMYYASGKAAMQWNWAGFQTIADLPDFSAIPGMTRSVMLPGGDGPAGRRVSLLVYWVMTIARGCANPDLAYQLLRHLAKPEMDKITALSGGSGVRKSTWNDAEIRDKFRYYDSIEEVHRSVRFLPRIPEYPAINDVINDMMASLVRGQGDIDAALKEATGRVEGIMDAAGYYE
jgi:multiple sugar transport system substrate-binding protein